MRRQKASWVGGLTLPGSCRAAAAPHQSAGGSCGVLAVERLDEARAGRGCRAGVLLLLAGRQSERVMLGSLATVTASSFGREAGRGGVACCARRGETWPDGLAGRGWLGGERRRRGRMRGEGEGTWERRRRLGCAHGEGRERDWRGMERDLRGGEGRERAAGDAVSHGREGEATPKKVCTQNSLTFVLLSCKETYMMQL